MLRRDGDAGDPTTELVIWQAELDREREQARTEQRLVFAAWLIERLMEGRKKW